MSGRRGGAAGCAPVAALSLAAPARAASPVVDLGVGDSPAVAVDRAGTAHRARRIGSEFNRPSCPPG